MSFYHSDVILSFWCHSIILLSFFWTCNKEQGRVKFDSGLFHITGAKQPLLDIVWLFYFVSFFMPSYHSNIILSTWCQSITYLIFVIFLHAHILSHENFTLGKCINLRQNCQKQYFSGSSGFFLHSDKLFTRTTFTLCHQEQF